MIIDNIAIFQDKYSIQVNDENDALFYYFDYDVRSADINMQFQHFHTFYELCIMLGPNTAHFIEGVPYHLQNFDIVAIAPNQLHKSQYPTGKSSRRIIIQFNIPKNTPGLTSEYSRLLSMFHQETPIFRFDRDTQEKLYRKLNEIYRISKKGDSMRNLIIHLKFVEFLTLIYLNQDKNLYSNEAEMSDMEEKIYAIAGYIHVHYPENLSLDLLASKFDVSCSYLSRQFKNVTGFSVTDYIQMTRIRNVQAMLVNTQIPITEVCAPCGFNSFSQFNRVFRKHIGMSPSAYRKEYQLQQSEFDT